MLNVGIIGLGVGEAHIAGYNAHPGSCVTTICDLNPARAKQIQDKFGNLQIARTDDDVIKDPSIQVVSIASYDNDHYRQVMEALKNDKHVFVEKPLCLFEHEARDIKRALNEKPHLRMSSNLILRKSPRFAHLKKLMDQGKLGQIYYIEGDYNYGRIHKLIDSWRGDLDFYSVTLGGGIHLVDLLLWLTNDEVVEVSAQGNRICSEGTKFKFNDLTVALLKFKSGMVGKVASNFGCVSPHYHQLSVYGTRGTFINDLPHGRLYTSRDAKEAVQPVTEAYPGVPKDALIFNFIESILTGNPQSADVAMEDVFKALSVCFAIDDAVRQGSTVTVNYI
jgi:predicted dehydrogenase